MDRAGRPPGWMGGEPPLEPDEAVEVVRSSPYWRYPVDLPPGLTKRVTLDWMEEWHLRRAEHFFRPLLDRCDGSLAGRRVLDLACCQGFWSVAAVRHGAAYCLGIDSSEIFVREANAVRTLHGYQDRWDLRVANLEGDLWWEDLDPFDVTLFLGIFYHLADPIHVLRRALALTRGVIVVDTELIASDRALLEIVPRNPEDESTRHANLTTGIRVIPSRPAVEALLRDGGFGEIAFLMPGPDMPEHYRTGGRGTLIARRR